MATYAVIPPRVSADRPLGPFGLNDASEQANGLVAWWPLTQYAGVMDLTSRHLGGTRSASGLSSRGVPGHGLTLTNDGSGSVSIGDPIPLQITGQITLSAWVLAPIPGGAWGYFIGKGYDGSAEAYFLRFSASNTIDVGSFGSGTATASWSAGSAWDATRPHLVTGVYDGATWRLYVDGQQRATAAAANGAVTSTAGVYLAATYITSSVARWLTGSLWDCRIYNRGLSPGEAAALWDVSTRWDLYAVPSRRVYFNVGALGGSTWPGYQSPFGWH